MLNNNNDKLKSYGLAMYEIAKESDQLKKYYDQFLLLKEIFKEDDNTGLIKLFAFSDLSLKEKEKIIDKVFKGFEEYIINFLKLINSKNYFIYIRKIIFEFIKISSLELNIINGYVYSSKPLDSNLIKELEMHYFKKLHKIIYLKNVIDESLISGIKLRIGDYIFENSVISNIKLIKEKILKGKEE